MVHAMPTYSRFEQKHVAAIVSKLVCHDRVIFKGYLPFGGTDQLNGWIDYGLKVLKLPLYALRHSSPEA